MSGKNENDIVVLDLTEDIDVSPPLPTHEASGSKHDTSDDIIVQDLTAETVSLMELNDDFGENISTVGRRGSDTSLGSNSQNSSFRAKTRLLSRSHSVNDLTKGADEELTEKQSSRRNSSGDFTQKFLSLESPFLVRRQVTPSPTGDISSNKTSYIADNFSFSPVSSSPVQQLSPVSLQHPLIHSAWKGQKSYTSQEDTFGVLLHTTAERVLTRLKSRQQDLGSNYVYEKKNQIKNLGHGPHQGVPRKLKKLQPISRQGSNSEFDSFSPIDNKKS